MKNSKQKKPFLLYTIIIILALVILALGGLTLYSFQDLASLRSKVTDLQNTVQEISDTSAELISQAKGKKSIGIIIGPEGGFEKEEIEQLKAAGGQTMSLGKRILRTETAGMTVLSILMFTIEE